MKFESFMVTSQLKFAGELTIGMRMRRLCIYLPALYNGAGNKFLVPSFGNI